MHQLPERLLRTIRKTNSLRPGDRVAAAVSGGADSVALLCLLIELRADLGIVLSVAHVNHKLRGEESDEDERFVAQLAEQHGLELHSRAAPVDEHSPSGNRSAGIEAAARELRYDFFRALAHHDRVAKIATAHTLDDQAETILLRIFRGTGIRGLAGIHPRIIFEHQGSPFGEVIRPLLGFHHAALQEFLRERGQPWREDSSNRSVAFLRNRVRHRLLPMITKEFGDAAIEHMSELAEIARAEEEHWTIGHPDSHPDFHPDFQPATTVQLSAHPTAPLPLPSLLALPLAAQRRLLRTWLAANAPDVSISFRLIEQALELAHSSDSEDSEKPHGKKLELPGGWNLSLEGQRTGHEFLRLDSSPLRDNEAGDRQKPGYQYALSVPGMVDVPELSARIEALVVDPAKIPDAERAQLLDIARLPKEILIRNWRPGDRYWPAHTAAPRNVKELLNDRHATGTGKKLWPVAVADGCGLVWMRGFAVPAAFQAPSSAAKAISIRELRA